MLVLQFITGTFTQETLPAPCLSLAARGASLNCKTQAPQETQWEVQAECPRHASSGPQREEALLAGQKQE